MSSFGYFEDIADDLQVLQHLHDALKPGGQVLLEMAGKEPLARTFQPRTWHRHAEWDEYLRTYLFTTESILEIEESQESETRAAEGYPVVSQPPGATQPAAQPERPRSFTVGSLRPTRG